VLLYFLLVLSRLLILLSLVSVLQPVAFGSEKAQCGPKFVHHQHHQIMKTILIASAAIAVLLLGTLSVNAEGLLQGVAGGVRPC
jgi:hypothetical protein